MQKLRPILKWTNIYTRRILIKALVISRIEFLGFTFVSASEPQINRLHKLIMTAGRLIFGSYGFKISCQKILETSQLLMVRRMLRTTAVKFVAGVLSNRKPLPIYSLFQTSKRFTAPITTKYLPKTSKFRKFYLYKMVKYYNDLPIKYKNCSLKKFKRRECWKMTLQEASLYWGLRLWLAIALSTGKKAMNN